MSEDYEWLTVNEAAAVSGYHPVYLRWLIRKGKIDAVKKGLTWWVNRASLEFYLREGRKSGNGRRSQHE